MRFRADTGESDRESRRVGGTVPHQASVEGLQSKLQRVVRLAFEYVRSNATEGRRLAILVLALGAPVCRAVDDLFIAPCIDHLKFMVRYAAGLQPGEELLDRRWTRRHLVVGR